MNDWIYAGAVLFGAFSLLIEADRNYRTTLGKNPFPYHAILEKVDLENLCTPREWMSGFLFYSLLYLLSYGVILSSTELFLLVRNANLAELEVGAHTDFIGPLSDPMELADSNYGKPIFVSAFLIAFLSMGAMKPVEVYMRALAHRLAGVPRGVYNVLERLQSIDYLKENAKSLSPLVKKFDSLMADKAFKDVTDQYTADIRSQLSAIDCLSPSVTAGFSRLHFPLSHFDAFKDLPLKLAEQIEEVDELIDELQPNEASLKALHEKSVIAANSSKAVFAVFYVRNNHAIKNTDPRSPIAKIEKQITRGYRTELNSFAMSMFLGVIISMLVACWAYYDWRNFRVTAKPVQAAEQIRTAWDKASPEGRLALLETTPVALRLQEASAAKLSLPAGTEATYQGPEGETIAARLDADTPARVQLPADTPVALDLPAGSKLRVTELPDVDLVPMAGLPAQDSEDGYRVRLPEAAGAEVALVSERTVTLPLPVAAKASVELEGGVIATADVSAGQDVTLTLDKGMTLAVGLAAPSEALAAEGAKMAADGQLALPTFTACLYRLNEEAEQRGAGGQTTDADPACATAAADGKASWLASQYSRIAAWSFWDVLQRAMMVFATVVATIFFREVRVDQNSWKPWSLNRIPFLRLLTMSITPALIGVFALSTVFLFQLLWEAGFVVSQRQVTELFQSNWVYFAWHVMPCMVLSITALILMDKHDDWFVEGTLFVGLVSAAILVGLSALIYMVNDPPPALETVQLRWLPDHWEISRRGLRDTVTTAIFPATFILLFAWFLELTENHRTSNSVIVRAVSGVVGQARRSANPRAARTAALVLAAAALAALVWSLVPSAVAAQTTGEGGEVVSSGEVVDAAPGKEVPVLRIGVRSDARPFSYQSERNVDVLTAATPGPLAQAKYTGFMIKICDAVLTEMLVNPMVPASEDGAESAVRPLQSGNIRIVDVDKLLAGNPTKSRFEYFGSEFDILCDPSTITNERRSGLILSAPLFLSGISFIDLHRVPKPIQDGCPALPLIGLVGNTTAVTSGIRAIIDADEFPRYRALLIDWLEDRKNQCEKGRDDYQAVKVYTSHSAAAQAFCDGRFHYYLGDQEIITQNARQITGCDFDHAARTLTVDRYAIFGKIDYTDTTRALWVARFFEILSQKVPFSPSIIDIAFSDTFVGTDKSRALDLFFWSVRGEN